MLVDIGDGFDLEEEALDFDDDDPNLCEVFMATEEGKKALKKISDRVITDFDTDFEASRQYRERMADDLRLFMGDLPPKTFPFQNSANAHVPMMMENTIRLAFRLEDEIWGDGTNVFGVLPVGPGDEEIAQNLALHGNWQIREKITDFHRQFSRAVMLFCIAGDFAWHSYWDPVRRLNCHETLTPDEFITPYAFTTTRPDYSDLPHYTKIFRKYRHELQQMRDIWYDVDKVLDGKPPSFDDDPDESMREARAQVEGIEAEMESTAAPYKLLWYEGWLELPGRDRDHWCQVILDYRSKCVLQLTVHEETNWQDRIRFERQTAELQGFQQGMAMHTTAKDAAMQHAAQIQGTLQDDGSNLQAIGEAGAVGPEALAHGAGILQQKAQMGQAHVAQMAAQVPPAPIPPPWLKDPENPNAQPEAPQKDPIYMFSHGVCVEPLTGNLGLSFGRIQADLNRAVDTVTSQFIDSATIANTSSFVTTDIVEFDSPLEIAPGKINKLQGVPPGQLEQNFMQLKFADPNPALMGLVDKWIGYAQTSGQAPDVLGGAAGKSGETAHGLEARIEQATKPISVAARHFCIAFRQVLANNARLNAIYLPDDEMISLVSQKTGEQQQVPVSRDMYKRDYRVTISSDLRFASQAQRIAEADELVQLPGAVPALQQDLAYQYYTTVKALQARGRADVIPMLGGPPPIPTMFGEQQIQMMAQQMAQQMVQQMMSQQQQTQGPEGPKPAEMPPSQRPG
jgi:hypothetical protein